MTIEGLSILAFAVGSWALATYHQITLLIFFEAFVWRLEKDGYGYVSNE